MSISPATRQAFQTLHNVQPKELEATLQRAVQNDASAWSELQQQTGIGDAGQIAQAIDAYRSNSFEGLLGQSYQASTQTVTGSDSAPSFSPSQGGVSASQMDNLLNMRGGQPVGLSRLGSELSGLQTQKNEKSEELGDLVTKKGTLETELGGLSLNRRERWFGGAFAGVLGADKDKASRGKTLRKDIEATGEAIGDKKREINGVDGQMQAAVVSHLRSTSDSKFKAFDDKFIKTKNALSSVNSFLSDISDAQSAVSSALFHERMENGQEQAQARNHDQTPTTPGSIGSQNYMSDSANQQATSALRQVSGNTSLFQNEMQRYGLNVNLLGLQTTSTGNEYDQFSDMLSGSVGGALGGALRNAGSTMVIHNLHNAESELNALEGNVDGIHRQVKSDYDVAKSARQGYIDDVEHRALQTIN